MPANVAALVEEIARCLSEGRLDDLASLHRFPCAFEARGRLDVFLRPADLAAAVGRWRERKWRRGVRRISARVVARDLGPEGRRCRAWVQWTDHLADGTAEDGGTDLLFLSGHDRGALAVEMIDFLSLPAPPDAKREAPLSAAG